MTQPWPSLGPHAVPHSLLPSTPQDPKHHVEAYWHRGSGGLRPQGHDFEEEEQRLHELEQVWGRGGGPCFVAST